MIIGLLGYYFMAESSGGVERWLSVPRGDTDYNVVSGYHALAIEFLHLGTVLFFLVFNLRKSRLGLLILSSIPITINLLWYLYLGSRSRTIALFLSFLLCIYLPKQKNPSFKFIIPVFLILFTITNFLEYNRDYFRNLSFNLDRVDVASSLDLALPNFLGGNLDYKEKIYTRGAEANVTMTVIDLVPDQIKFNYGYTMLEFFTRPIPRFLWKNKIYPLYEAQTPIMAKGQLSYTTIPNSGGLLAGPAFGFLGYWYHLGGFLGLLIGGLWTGFFLKFLRQIYKRNPNSEGNLILFLPLVLIGFKEAAATPFNWIFTLPFILIVLVLVLKFTKIKT